VKKSLSYEIIAAVLAMTGAIILVFFYYPLLNPIQFKIDSHEDTPSIGYYIFVTPIPLLILFAVWRFNCKAQRIKKAGAKANSPN